MWNLSSSTWSDAKGTSTIRQNVLSQRIFAGFLGIIRIAQRANVITNFTLTAASESIILKKTSLFYNFKAELKWPYIPIATRYDLKQWDKSIQPVMQTETNSFFKARAHCRRASACGSRINIYKQCTAPESRVQQFRTLQDVFLSFQFRTMREVCMSSYVFT